MNRLFKCFHDKWVKGLCPHICCICKYKDSCDAEYKYTQSKYLKGFDAGYDAAEYNYLKIVEKLKQEHAAEIQEYIRKEQIAYDDGMIDCKRMYNYHSH